MLRFAFETICCEKILLNKETNSMNPKLYIVMRRDLAELNPGKAMAQAAHAQADMLHAVCNAIIDQQEQSSQLRQALTLWKEDRTFGTTLVLHEPLETMHAIRCNVAHSAYTVDPTYPCKNWYGETFCSEQVTCMWAFVFELEEIEFMQQFELHQ